jgi:hypothetical protein
MPIKSFVILVVLATIAAILFVELASMPGEIARRRGHPQARAISLLGWIGLPFGVAPWFIALIWSNLDPMFVSRDLDANNQSNAKPDDDTAAAT